MRAIGAEGSTLCSLRMKRTERWADGSRLKKPEGVERSEAQAAAQS
jgi:hypothetical protein